MARLVVFVDDPVFGVRRIPDDVLRSFAEAEGLDFNNFSELVRRIQAVNRKMFQEHGVTNRFLWHLE